jgi:protein TonB
VSWSFTLTGADGLEVEVPLSQAALGLGRSKTGDIYFSDTSTSRGHARIVVRKGEAWLEDIDTPGGAHVNEVRVTECRLRGRDRIRMGFCDEEVVVHEAGSRVRLSFRSTVVVIRQAGEDRLASEVILPGDELFKLRVAERGETERYKKAAVAAILAHFVLFALVIPVSSREIMSVGRDQATVIKRYKPPEPQQPEKRVRRGRVRAVPIPDPTPGGPEPIVIDSESDQMEFAPVNTDWVTYLPEDAPVPEDLSGAYEMGTVGLSPPEVMHQVQPRYDRSSARRGVQGAVDIEVVIDERGLIGFARIINGLSDEELDRLALEAVRQWRFRPATMGSDPVAVRAVVTVNFRIY